MTTANYKSAEALTKFLILAAIFNGFSSGVSTGMPQGASTRLTNGTVVSAQDYQTNSMGAASIAVLVESSGQCVGVMISPTLFATGCQIRPDDVVAVGSRYSPGQPQFDGQTLNRTGLPVISSNRNIHYSTLPVQGIPSGSQAKVAVLYPAGTPPPAPGADCIAYGYSGPSPLVLNYRPAIVTTPAVCNATYPPFPSDGTQFCAIVSDLNGNSAICPRGDIFTVIVCQGPVTNHKREQLFSAESDGQPGTGSLKRFCLFNPHLPICQLFCPLNPFCGNIPENETEEQWYLAGILIRGNNNCGQGPTRPTLFNFVLPN